jgi:hypothetical protein
MKTILKHGASLHDFKHAMIFRENVEESCTFQKIYTVGKVKPQTKWSIRLKKTNANLGENYLKKIVVLHLKVPTHIKVRFSF